MSGLLTHSPADVIRKLMEDLGAVTGAYVSNEPDTPDDVVTFYDTAGRVFPCAWTGTRCEHNGVLVRVRSATHSLGYAQANAIAVAADGVSYVTVVIENTTYTVEGIYRLSDVLALGKEVPDSRRSLFTVNLLAVLKQEQ